MTSAPRSRAALAVLLSLLTVGPASSRGAEPLDVDFARDGIITLAAGGFAGAVAHWAREVTPSTCRFCDPNAFDERARAALLWRDTGRAGFASDVLANGVLPGAAALYAVAASWGDGGPRQAGEDALVIAEAIFLSSDLNEIVKSGAGRLRPSAWVDGRFQGVDSNRSFYSGHTAFAFSLASAAGTVATIRGYRSAPWVWAVGMSLAAGVAYLRVGADAHWVTDVLAGAVLGGATGFAVPWLLHRPRDGKEPAVQLLPAPGGFALVW